MDHFLQINMCLFLVVFAVFCFEEYSSFCRENEILTHKRQKLDQFQTLQQIYIYIYACICEVIICPSLAFSGVIIWSKVGPLSGPSLFSSLFCSGFKRFLNTQLSFCVFSCSIIWQFSKNSLFKKGCQNWVFQFSLF